jgi:uncharacterized membrane protein YcgQ (UPF0703/DUF1980 family)
MKRISILLALCLVFALAGCQAKPDDNRSAAGGGAQAADNQNNNGVPAAGGQIPDSPPQTASAPVLTAQKPEINGNLVEIKENLFIAQLNDVYLNQDDYLGKTIKYEGMFKRYSWDETGMTYYLVYRNSPGCCGADGQAGFEVIWPEGSDKAYPAETDWCEVIGTLETYDESGENYLHVVLKSLTALDNRGAEYVSQ